MGNSRQRVEEDGRRVRRPGEVGFGKESETDGQGPLCVPCPVVWN